MFCKQHCSPNYGTGRIVFNNGESLWFLRTKREIATKRTTKPGERHKGPFPPSMGITSAGDKEHVGSRIPRAPGSKGDYDFQRQAGDLCAECLCHEAMSHPHLRGTSKSVSNPRGIEEIPEQKQWTLINNLNKIMGGNTAGTTPISYNCAQPWLRKKWPEYKPGEYVWGWGEKRKKREGNWGHIRENQPQRLAACCWDSCWGVVNGAPKWQTFKGEEEKEEEKPPKSLRTEKSARERGGDSQGRGCSDSQTWLRAHWHQRQCVQVPSLCSLRVLLLLSFYMKHQVLIDISQSGQPLEYV